MVTEMSRPIGAHDLTMQTGKLAKLADGAVVVTYGQTQVLATCVRSKPREGIDFFPLTIDVEERAYAAGKIPGSFFRREGRPRRDRDPDGSPDRPPAAPDLQGRVPRRGPGGRHGVVGGHGEPLRHPGDERGRLRRGPRRAAVRRPGRRRAPGPDRRRVGGQPDLPGDRGRDVRHRRRRVQERRRRRRHPDDRGRGPRATRGRCSPSGALAPTEEVVAQGLEVAKTEIAKIIAFQEEFIAAHGVSEMEFDADAAVRRRHLGRRVRELRRQARGRDRARQAGARRGVRRGQGRGQGAPGGDAGRGRASPSARHEFGPRHGSPCRRRSCADA